MKTIRIVHKAVAPALCAALLTLTACHEKTLYTHAELYGTSLTLRADWGSGTTPTSDALDVAVESLNPDVDYRQTHKLTAGGVLNLDLLESRYQLTATHAAENVTYNEASATFSLTPGSDGVLPQPGALSACRTEVQLDAQQTTPVVLPLHRLTRTLVLRFRLGAQQAGQVTGMEVRISGMASVIDINGTDRSTGAPGIVVPALQTAQQSDEVVYEGSYRTFGTVGSSQTMEVTVHLDNGQQFSVQTDIGRTLRGLNACQEETFTAAFQLDTAGHPGSDTDFTIGPWQDGGGDSDGDAGMEIPEE